MDLLSSRTCVPLNKLRFFDQIFTGNFALSEKPIEADDNEAKYVWIITDESIDNSGRS